MDFNSIRLHRIARACLFYVVVAACGLAVEIGLVYVGVKVVLQGAQ